MEPGVKVFLLGIGVQIGTAIIVLKLFLWHDKKSREKEEGLKNDEESQPEKK